MRTLTWAAIGFVSLLGCSWVGCQRAYREDLDYDHEVVQTWQVDELPNRDFVQFESVFWEADDSVSLRKLIADDDIAAHREVLEIGTGTGLLSILCLLNDAKRVVATDIHPAAVANAKYNAAMLGVDGDLDVRQVDPAHPEAFAVIAPHEQFDLILSNPPWEEGAPQSPAEHAYYDPEFQLMDSLLEHLPKHLRPGGRCLLAYGHRPAIERLLASAAEHRYSTKILDDRDLDSLPRDFLPGMLIEIRCPAPAATPGTAATPSESSHGSGSAERSDSKSPGDAADVNAPGDSAAPDENAAPAATAGENGE